MPMRFANIMRLNEKGEGEFMSMRWGFVGKDDTAPTRPKHMHARSETIDTLPTFKILGVVPQTSLAKLPVRCIVLNCSTRHNVATAWLRPGQWSRTSHRSIANVLLPLKLVPA